MKTIYEKADILKIMTDKVPKLSRLSYKGSCGKDKVENRKNCYYRRFFRIYRCSIFFRYICAKICNIVDFYQGSRFIIYFLQQRCCYTNKIVLTRTNSLSLFGCVKTENKKEISLIK